MGSAQLAKTASIVQGGLLARLQVTLTTSGSLVRIASPMPRRGAEKLGLCRDASIDTVLSTRARVWMTIGPHRPWAAYPTALAFYLVAVHRVRVLPAACFRSRLAADTLALADGSGHHGRRGPAPPGYKSCLAYERRARPPIERASLVLSGCGCSQPSACWSKSTGLPSGSSSIALAGPTVVSSASETNERPLALSWHCRSRMSLQVSTAWTS